jgi:hypothetical protein
MQPIIEHFDVRKDVLCRFVPCTVLTMINELAFQCVEEAFDTRLSQQFPRRDMLPVIPCIVSNCWYAVAAY